MERRLAAIVIADVVGYSKLIRDDEAGTRTRFQTLHQDVFGPAVSAHGGRVIKTMGDAFLLEFPSAVEAVACSTKVQQELAALEADKAEGRRIRFRFGINLGDIIVEDDDIHGDGVNVAARLEELSEPGGILISGSVHEQVLDKLDIVFEDMGEVEVKNIARPVRVFRVLAEGQVSTVPLRPVQTKRWFVAAAVVLLIAAAGGSAWWWWQQPNFAPVNPAKMAYKLPDKPSIAVLPFANLSGEPEQESFADGISEDLTTQLSKISGLFVISRTTAFQYKGRTADIRQLAQDLGVRYIIEGSVRRAGDQIRINAQLIDAVTGGHLWAETFDGAADEVFALQDRINGNIVAALKVELTPEEEARVSYRGTENVPAYDAFLRGERFRRYGKTAAHVEAIREYERAIELDPNFGAAHAALGDVLWSREKFDTGGGYGNRDNLARAHMLVEKAITLGEDPLAHIVLSKIFLYQKVDHVQAEQEARKAIALDPNSSESLVMQAEVQLFAGQVQAATALLQKAMRLNPIFPDRYRMLMAQALFDQRRYSDALDQFAAFCEGASGFVYYIPCLLYMSSAYGHLGETAAGQVLIKRWIRFDGTRKSIDNFETLAV